jgi:alkylation response protein AidB-like acyl-CoA dehydrogenase
MYFGLNAEQRELQASLGQFLADQSPVSAARELIKSGAGHDPAIWKRMTDELGLTAIAVPEEFDGLGASFVELVVVLETMGQHLLSAPFFSTAVLATRALLNAGDEQANSDYLPAIVAGRTIATLALLEESASWELDAVAMAAVKTPTGYQLTGRKTYVTDGVLADLLLVVARTDAGLALFAVAGDAIGLTRTEIPALDQTRPLATLDFAATPARLIGVDGAAATGLQRTLDEAAVALAAEQVGGAQRCLDMAVEYAATRVAFGRPIGSFQAIKHKCADLLIGITAARSALYYSAWTVEESSAELAFAAAAAKAHCSETYVRAAQQNIQIHGGIGFTWEHDAHLYLKRAVASAELLGAPNDHLARIADQLSL